MNICFFMEDLNIGGVETVSLKLIEYFSLSNDFNVSVVCLSNSGDLKDKFNKIANVYEYDSILELSYFDVVLFTKGGLSRFYRKFNPDVYKIAIQHVPIDLPNSSFLRNYIRKIGAKFLYNRMDRVITVSKGIEDNLNAKLNLSKNLIRTIYNPVISEDIICQAQDFIPEYKDYYICVGRLHYQKGYDRLINIICDVKKVHPKIKVLIVGGGELQDELQKNIVDNDLVDNIILLGSLKNPYPFIKNAKAILLTSRWEGLPTVLVEASHLDIPIISFDCRYGPSELTDNGRFGILVENNNEFMFKEAILEFEAGKLLAIPCVNDFTLEVAGIKYSEEIKKARFRT